MGFWPGSNNRLFNQVRDRHARGYLEAKLAMLWLTDHFRYIKILTWLGGRGNKTKGITSRLSDE